jgi:hypothetical protein
VAAANPTEDHTLARQVYSVHLPHLAGVVVDAMVLMARRMRIMVGRKALGGDVHHVRSRLERMHGCYVRALDDLGWAGRQVETSGAGRRWSEVAFICDATKRPANGGAAPGAPAR